MGCMTEFVCNTCRKRYYLGYGSYSRYDERLAKFDASKHTGHDTFHHSGDFDYQDGDDLYQQGPYGSKGELLAKDYAKYEIVTPEPSEREGDL